MVPEVGIEPTLPKEGDFESPVSTNSTIQAWLYRANRNILKKMIKSIFNKKKNQKTRLRRVFYYQRIGRNKYSSSLVRTTMRWTQSWIAIIASEIGLPLTVNWQPLAIPLTFPIYEGVLLHTPSITGNTLYFCELISINASWYKWIGSHAFICNFAFFHFLYNYQINSQ